MSWTDHILAILNGLGDEYESIVAIISSQKIPHSLETVGTLLLSYEGRILTKKLYLVFQLRCLPIRQHRRSFLVEIRKTIKDIILKREFFKITIIFQEEILLEIKEEAGVLVGIITAGHNANHVENLDTQSKNATVDLI